MRNWLTNHKCPKCGGNVYHDTDQYGWYEQCLQCGHFYATERPQDMEQINNAVDEPTVALKEPVTI